MGATAGARTFIDTNVLVSAIDDRDTRKRERARETLARLDRSQTVLSTQVLIEYFNVATAKPPAPLPRQEVAREVAELSELETIGDARFVRYRREVLVVHLSQHVDF